MADLLDGFDDCPVDLDGVRINARRAGAGPPLLLLHGYPQSMVMWHRIAPSLAADFAVVVADLRGYGGSSKPAGGPGHRNYTKRALALDMVTLMTRLGHERFVVVGHDRGGRVAHRMALDARDRVAALAVLDIVPTRHMFTHVDRAMATAYFHWFFLTVADDLPEKLINGNPEAWIDSRFAGRHGGGLPIDDAALAEYRRVFTDPRAVHATCEDYRAAAGPDLEARPGGLRSRVAGAAAAAGAVGRQELRRAQLRRRRGLALVRDRGLRTCCRCRPLPGRGGTCGHRGLRCATFSLVFPGSAAWRQPAS